MRVFHLTPEYIMDNWTEDQLCLYIKTSNKLDAMLNGDSPSNQEANKRTISSTEFENLPGIEVEYSN